MYRAHCCGDTYNSDIPPYDGPKHCRQCGRVVQWYRLLVDNRANEFEVYFRNWAAANQVTPLRDKRPPRYMDMMPPFSMPANEAALIYQAFLDDTDWERIYRLPSP